VIGFGDFADAQGDGGGRRQRRRLNPWRSQSRGVRHGKLQVKVMRQGRHGDGGNLAGFVGPSGGTEAAGIWLQVI
jgi:hypothetical protein